MRTLAIASLVIGCTTGDMDFDAGRRSDAASLPDATLDSRSDSMAPLDASPPTEPPDGVPGEFVVSEVMATAALGSWTDTSSNEENFVIERWDGTSSSWVEHVLAPANATSTTLIDLAPDTEYGMRVRARNALGQGDPSNEQWFTTLPAEGDVCGNGTCGAGESCSSCEDDCGACAGGTVFLLKDATFEGGRAGDSPTNGSTGFDREGSGNQFSTEQVYTGSLSSQMFKYPGVRTFTFGGRMNYPSSLREGDEVWWRAAVYFPTREDFNANPRLKFMRVLRLNHGDGSGWGLDWYINDNGTHRYIYEPPGTREDTGETVTAQGLARADDFGTSGDPASAVIAGEWAEWQVHVRLHRHPADSRPDGAFVRFYKNGVLIHERSDLPTLLRDADGGYADYGLFMTYWNGVGDAFPTDGSWFVDDFTIAVNRDLTGSLEGMSLATEATRGYPIIPMGR